MDRRYKKNICFDVQYFSNKEDMDNDFLEIGDNLFKMLEYVKADNKKYRALQMKYEILNKVMHFTLQFNFNIASSIEDIKMEKLEVDISGK